MVNYGQNAAGKRFFQYRPLRNPPRNAAGVLKWRRKPRHLLTVEYLDAYDNPQEVRHGKKYKSTTGSFPSIPAALPGLSYARTVLDRQNPNVNCIMGTRASGHVCTQAACTPRAFYQQHDQHASLELRETENMGIGVFATQAIANDTKIGIYTGKVMPYPALTDAEKEFTFEIKTLPGVAGPAGKVQINALRRGNWPRFLNHSCVPNCSLSNAMNLGDVQVCYVRTKQTIWPGDELFVDYARDFFRTPAGRIRGQGCLCGKSTCHSKKVAPRPAKVAGRAAARAAGRAPKFVGPAPGRARAFLPRPCKK